MFSSPAGRTGGSTARPGCSTGSTGTCAPDGERGSGQGELRPRGRQLAGRSPVAGQRRPLERGRQGSASAAGREPADEEPGVEGVAGAGRVRRGEVLRRDLEAEMALALDARGPWRPLSPRLTTAIGAYSSRPSTAYRAQQRLGLRRRREQQVRGDVRRSSARAARRPWASSGPIEARSTLTTRVLRACELDGRAGRRAPAAPRAASRPAGGGHRSRGTRRDGCRRGRAGPRRRDRRRTTAPRRARRARRSDPSWRPGRGSRAGRRRSRANGIDERAAGRVATDRGDQRRPGAEPAEPAGGVRGRAALDQGDAAGHVRAELERPGGSEDDVEHQVAQDDDPGLATGRGAARTSRPTGRRGRGGRSRGMPRW